ncbi:MAG: hypothetical protein ACOYNS_08385 [Bacteroidota bacterium]
MKKHGSRTLALLLCTLAIAAVGEAQGFGQPLTFQGLDHFTTPSVTARSFGGVTFGSADAGVGMMFTNPSSLQGLSAPRISVGGAQYYSDAAQKQQYSPLKYYSNFSLLMEGLTGVISNPTTYDTSLTYQAKDSVQRPFDKIAPGWSTQQPHAGTINVFAAVPLSVGDMKFSVGAGMAEYSDLTWTFQNNNVLSPSILSVNPNTTTIPPNNLDTNSIPVRWFQYTQQRTGSIQSYGGALSAALWESFTVGVNAMLLKGNSDDRETQVERGRIRFYQNFFRAESVYYRSSTTGTSKYDGQEFTVSVYYRGKFVGLGLSVKPATTITRTYSSVVRTDTIGASSATASKGEDKMTIPMRGSAAITIAVRENLTLGLQYDLRPYASAEYQRTGKSVTKPWISANVLHLGLEYRPMSMLTLRAGAREQAEVFEPNGNPLPGESARSTVYSVGFGAVFSGLHLNAVYEYSKLKYIDMWASAVSINTVTAQTVSADLSYEIPW